MDKPQFEQHISHRFDADLEAIKSHVLGMGGEDARIFELFCVEPHTGFVDRCFRLFSRLGSIFAAAQ